jgi:RNA-binding protein
MGRMNELTSTQRKFLRGVAHHLDPVVLIGKHGLTEALVKSAAEALEAHELIKVKFNDFKTQKDALLAELCEKTGCAIAGRVGNVGILYREQPDPEKRLIQLPE